MSNFVRPTKNYVNLGNLYQFKYLHKSTPGWAYFEDGSMFIVPRDYVQHKILEARMNIVAHLVSNPRGKLHAQLRQHEDSTNSRFVVVGQAGKNLPDKEMIVSARSASMGERIISLRRPFLRFIFTLDKTGQRRPLAKFFAKDEDIIYKLPELREALLTFRGTLVNGTLQPNVRLGNGLTLRGMHNVGVDAESLTPRNTHKAMRKVESKPQSLEAQKPVRRGMSALASKKLALQAKERELALKEELLQWKQKTFGLAQKLAKHENRTQRRLPTVSKNLDRKDQLSDSRSWEDNPRRRTRPRYSGEPDSRYPAHDIRPQTRAKYRDEASHSPGSRDLAEDSPETRARYRDEDSHSPDSRDSAEDPPAALILDYEVRAERGASPERAQFPPDADTQTTHYAPPAVEPPASTPSDSSDKKERSWHDDLAHESTSDMSSSILGTDTSAPPALDGLRTLLAELDNMDKREKTTRRRRSRSR